MDFPLKPNFPPSKSRNKQYYPCLVRPTSSFAISNREATSAVQRLHTKSTLIKRCHQWDQSKSILNTKDNCIQHPKHSNGSLKMRLNAKHLLVPSTSYIRLISRRQEGSKNCLSRYQSFRRYQLPTCQNMYINATLFVKLAVILFCSLNFFLPTSASSFDKNRQDPSILAIFRDTHDDKQVELERMVSRFLY